MPTNPLDSRSICASSQIGNDTAFGAVTPPLYLSSTYKFEAFDKVPTYDYGRSGNPNRDGLGKTIADLEHGAGGIVTSSGMAALDLVLNLLPPNGVVIAPHDLYGGTHRLLLARQKQGRLTVHFTDQSDPDSLDRAFAQSPDMILIETPSNPLIRIVDVSDLTARAQAAGALSVVDNTFLSPARQNPILLGADLVVHSATKFLNGHSDVVSGAVVSKSKEMHEELSWWANCTGVTGAPFDSYLILRGLRTLHVRMDAQEANTKAIAEFLSLHPLVKTVHYPGLKSDPGYELARKQQSGPGAMISFELNANREDLGRFFAPVKLFQLAESLGGTETLISHPASMTHRAMDDDARATAGISETLIRLSVGIEHSDDQIAELTRLFNNLD